MKKYSEIEKKYNEKQLLWKTSIRLEPNKWKRFWKWVWFFIAFPWVWLFVNIRDFHTFIIFLIVVLVVGVEVWLPYLLFFITGNGWFLGIASACLLFWWGPGTPFMLICIFLTIWVKGIFNKIKHKKESGVLVNTPKK